MMYFKKCRSIISTVSLSLILIMMLSGCNDPSSVQIYTEGDSLRNTVEEYGKKVVWINALEENRLSNQTNSVTSVDKSLRLTPENIILTKEEISFKPVFPEVKDFGYLNTDNMPKSALKLIEEFSSAVLEGKDLEPFMQKGRLYSLLVFLYDYPDLNDKTFSGCIKGEAFIGDDGLIQCPLRFFYSAEDDENLTDIKVLDNKGAYLMPSLDVSVFLEKEENDWKINQLVY